MKHILAVDDNKTTLLSVKAALAEQYKVTAVTMGSQALKFLEGNICDLILLDVDMPQMDGFQVMEELAKRTGGAHPPVVFLTGNTDPGMVERCLEKGCLDVLPKPFVTGLLLRRVGNLLELTEYRRQGSCGEK